MTAAASRMPPGPAPNAWPDDACLGAGLPEAAEQELALAGLHYGDPARALQHLERARELAPGHFAVDIGFYRFHFYQGRPDAALYIAEQCLARAAHELGMGRDWRDVAPEAADFAGFTPLPRFFLFALKGYAYLNLRLGRIAEGERALAKLAELDALDRLKGRVLKAVLVPEAEDD
ncbi:MAG: hypothetical protein HY749_19245 [Gammaproteobacteria bacterium]|nr:hypothetical protein [Gammaproteobacteria bacterium]